MEIERARFEKAATEFQEKESNLQHQMESLLVPTSSIGWSILG
jgi:hypothetical protein